MLIVSSPKQCPSHFQRWRRCIFLPDTSLTCIQYLELSPILILGVKDSQVFYIYFKMKFLKNERGYMTRDWQIAYGSLLFSQLFHV